MSKHFVSRPIATFKIFSKFFGLNHSNLKELPVAVAKKLQTHFITHFFEACLQEALCENLIDLIVNHVNAFVKNN